jgi:(1->4)-alpha-D-glucan 1-alpha-D-glucosylmutase
VYRTYLDGRASATDRRRLEGEVSDARSDLDADGARALDALGALLLEDRSEPVAVALQQLSGAVAAKGVEDTACYRYPGLLAAAEVGASPSRPAITIDEFHAELGARAKRSLGALNALSTHDTKRSADVRARLATLSEIPDEWARLVRRWHRRLKGAGRGVGPDPFDELFFFQSVFGLWPLEGGSAPDTLRDRLQVTMHKAAREAKRRTSWRDPDASYEAALGRFVDAALDDAKMARDLDRLAARLGPAAATYSLAMTLLAATAPGVPDVYQGSEQWQLALMDPDNRRRVDHAAAATELGQHAGTPVEELLAAWTDGRVKLHLSAAVLRLRRQHASLFARGRYVPLETEGAARERVVAFARRAGAAWAVTVVPRRVVPLTGRGRFALGPAAWAGTSVLLPQGAPRGFAGPLAGAEVKARRGRLQVADLLGALPVAVLFGTSRVTGPLP